MIELIPDGVRSTLCRREAMTPEAAIVRIDENLWDCVGDILTRGMIREREAGTPLEAGEIVIRQGHVFRPRHYTVETLLLTYMEMREKGWRIHMERDNVFYLDCPDFDTALVTTPEGGLAINANKRDYAHPIDAGIIQMLDNPAIKAVFGPVLTAMTDMQYSQIIASGVPVNARNFPEIDAIVNHCVECLGIKRPYVVISGSVGMNAMTMGNDDEPYIVLGNTLVRLMDHDKLTFIIGHECGHIAMGHVLYHALVNFASTFTQVIPVIGKLMYETSVVALTAWSRRSEITADRAGLLCCQNLEAAQKALLQLQTGFIDASNVDINDYINNSRRYRKGKLLRRMGEFSQTHPPLAKRIEALKLFANSVVYYAVQGIAAPSGCIDRNRLNSSIESLVAVMGED